MKSGKSTILAKNVTVEIETKKGSGDTQITGTAVCKCSATKDAALIDITNKSADEFSKQYLTVKL